MIIDSHHHFWDPKARKYPWMQADILDPIRRRFDQDDFEPLLKQHGVDGTVIVQTVSDIEESIEFLAVAGSWNRIKGVVGWVDLKSKDVATQIDLLKRSPGGEKLVGIRHQVHDEPDLEWLLRPDVLNGIAECHKAELAYDLLLKEPHMPAAIACVDKLPDVRFVVDHISKPRIAAAEMDPWYDLIGQLAQRPNVDCKVSGMVTEANWDEWKVENFQPYFDRVLEVFGANRLMYGSDWPVCVIAGGYVKIIDLAKALAEGLSEEEKDSLFGKTAIGSYRLSV
jgi:L-fuconolactonase